MTKSTQPLLFATAGIVLLALMALLVFTAPAVADNTIDPAKLESAAHQKRATANHDGHVTPPHQSAPHLEQALVIFTSVNGVLIVCGLLLILVKERLQRDSTQTLAMLKNARDIESNPAHNTQNKDIT